MRQPSSTDCPLLRASASARARYLFVYDADAAFCALKERRQAEALMQHIDAAAFSSHISFSSLPFVFAAMLFRYTLCRRHFRCFTYAFTDIADIDLLLIYHTRRFATDAVDDAASRYARERYAMPVFLRKAQAARFSACR